MARYTTEIPEEVNDLLKDAAKRDKRSKEQFIQRLFEIAANEEYAKQQCDDARTSIGE